MQDEEETINTTLSLNSLNAGIRVKGQQFSSDEERQAAQALFLAYLAETGVLIRSCKLAHISFPTYQAFLEEPDFAEGCQVALQDYKEKVFAEVDRRGRKGYLEPLVRNNTVVVDRKGNPVSVRKYSDRLLELLFNRFYPAKDMQQSGLAFSGTGEGGANGDGDIYVHLPWNSMTTEEQNIIETIGRNIDARAVQKGNETHG